MSIVADIARKVRMHMRLLAAMDSIRLRSDTAARILRIEISCKVEADFFHDAARYNMVPGDYYEREGPMQFMGIDLYIVNRLPPPGWRIINPFREAK